MNEPSHKTDMVGCEIDAPAGYYVPIEQNYIEHNGRHILYIRGSIYVEASCCGAGAWEYIAVRGYVDQDVEIESVDYGVAVDVQPIQDEVEKRLIAQLLRQKYPNARVEFK